MPGPVIPKPRDPYDVEDLASYLPESLRWAGGAALGGLKSLLGGTNDPNAIMMAGMPMSVPGASSAATGASGATPLAMDEASRMARAQEQGFTHQMYHGTTSRANFTQFNPSISDFGVHVTPNPETANAAIGWQPHEMDIGESYPGRRYSRVMPLQVRMQKTLDLPDMGLWKNPEEWSKIGGEQNVFPSFSGGGGFRIGPGINSGEQVASLYPPWSPATAIERSPDSTQVLNQISQQAQRGMYKNAYPYVTSEYDPIYNELRGIVDKHTIPPSEPGLTRAPRYPQDKTAFRQDIVDALQKSGYDSIKYNNYIEGKGEPSYILLDPRQIRSKFAAFDPAKFGKTKDIMAGLAMALGGASMASHKQE